MASMEYTLAILLIAALCLASAGAWWWLLSRRTSLVTLVGLIGPLPQISPWAAALAGLWLLNRLLIEFSGWWYGQPHAPFDPGSVLDSLRLGFLLQVGLLAIFWMAVSAGAPGGPRSLGITGSRFSCQSRSALLTVGAAWLPVFAALLLTHPLRTMDKQHSVLRMLQEQPTWETYLWAILSAVVMAPLIEELLFRVILQSWLSTHLGRRVGWVIASVLFAFVHGFPDSLAILPLALVLGMGWLINRRYWTIVIAHGVFNAVMLLVNVLLPEG